MLQTFVVVSILLQTFVFSKIFVTYWSTYFWIKNILLLSKNIPSNVTCQIREKSQFHYYASQLSQIQSNLGSSLERKYWTPLWLRHDLCSFNKRINCICLNCSSEIKQLSHFFVQSSVIQAIFPNPYQKIYFMIVLAVPRSLLGWLCSSHDFIHSLNSLRDNTSIPLKTPENREVLCFQGIKKCNIGKK